MICSPVIKYKFFWGANALNFCSLAEERETKWRSGGLYSEDSRLQFYLKLNLHLFIFSQAPIPNQLLFSGLKLTVSSSHCVMTYKHAKTGKKIFGGV